MNKRERMLKDFERNARTMMEERLAMVPFQARALQAKRSHELAVARASAPQINVKVYPQ